MDIDNDKILWSDYQRHDTKQPEKSLELLKNIEDTLGKDALAGVLAKVTDPGVRSDIRRMLRLIDEHRVTTSHMVPTQLHRLLALQLPTAPVQAGAQWMDPSSARPFAHPIPSSVPITITGTQRLVSIVLVKDRKSERPKLLHPPPHVRATIETSAAVLPADARFPALDIEGRADWNLASGVLEHRSLEVRERGGEGSGEPSTLFLEGWYVPEGSRPY